MKATAGDKQATVSFTAPASDGGSTITGYTVISYPSGGVDSQAGQTGTSHLITGLANGTSYTFTVKATNAVGNSADSDPSSSVTPTAPGGSGGGDGGGSGGGGGAGSGGRAGFIGFYPAQPEIPVLAGTGNRITPIFLNMGTEVGQAVAFDVSGILSRVLGVAFVYAGQSGSGTMLLNGVDGRRIAFTPVDFRYTNGREDGLYAAGNGRYDVVFSSFSLTIIPAVISLDQLRNSLPGATVAVSDKGVLLETLFNGTVHSMQPEVFVTRGNGGNVGLSSSTDGALRFTDLSGNVQRLNPAFADTSALQAGANTLDPSAQVTVNLDGTITLSLNGKTYTLVPDLVLANIPADKKGQRFWAEGVNRFRVSNDNPSGTSQGFTVSDRQASK